MKKSVIALIPAYTYAALGRRVLSIAHLVLKRDEVALVTNSVTFIVAYVLSVRIRGFLCAS